MSTSVTELRANNSAANEAADHSADRTRANLLFGVALTIFSTLLLCLTEPRFYADTMNYALHIVQHWQSQSAPGKDPLWDFGHLLWKPLGYFLWTCSGGPHSTDALLHAANVLIAMSIVFTLAGIILFYRFCTNYTGKPWVGFTVTVGLLATHAALNYAKTGTAYMAGMVCQIAALYWFERQLRWKREDHWTTWLLPGLFLGLSVLLWFPYCLTVPGS